MRKFSLMAFPIFIANRLKHSILLWIHCVIMQCMSHAQAVVQGFTIESPEACVT